ncbi:type II toxin-antitoxin system RelB/DinJ family antitoxin [Moraxella sp. K127]|uniref:Addiction module antitoxin n=1 Tax=Moraxella lacunata TaxID=477 RepID=A0A1V4H3C9_MORLA|nr:MULTISPECIES: type II toxin-antitoxin system RelB/DinJ family antitoxin [Moraxella]MBE9590879.1 type II toxin-antitoxin system RelB/DinJ family antitoxin [Moraxella sp. K127]OPH38896.1 addiction module antitoxin [Moraxella lacunata]STZ00178.1 Antitoxin RelB [Moraxella lacunata]
MTTTNLNIRIDDELKAQATKVLASYGLSPTQAIKLFFHQVVSTNQVPVSFDYQARTPNAKTLQAIAELENGGGTLYDDLDSLLAGLDNVKR